MGKGKSKPNGPKTGRGNRTIREGNDTWNSGKIMCLAQKGACGFGCSEKTEIAVGTGATH